MSAQTLSQIRGYLATMTRQVVLDTETTGLNAKLGDRIIEIGCVEILSRRLSERQFHSYLNPERDVDLGATRVHGLTLEDLLAKPKFADVARELLDARLLAECYLAMTRGQESLVMELETPAAAAAAAALMQVDLSNLILLPALPEEVALHEQYLDAMERERKGPSLWRRLLDSVPTT